MIDPSFLRKRNYKWRFPFFAVIFHIVVIGALFMLEIHYRREMIKDALKKIIEVRQITKEELDKLISRSRVVDTNWALELNPEKFKDRPAYRGEKTQRVEKETMAIGNASSLGKSSSEKASGKKLKDGLGAPVSEANKSSYNQGPSYDMIALDPKISISPKTFLNTDTFFFANFGNRLRDAIGIPWVERTKAIFNKNKSEFSIGIYVTTTKYSVAPDGTISNVVITRASGIAALDKAAVDSIYGAKVVQNPPPQLFQEPFNGSLEFSFYFYVVPGGAFRFNYFSDERLEGFR